MPPQFSRADACREYLSGAISDGAAQTNPNLSLGNYRSTTEAVSLGVTLVGSVPGVAILYAGGGNPAGQGTLTAVNANQLTWRPPGLTAGLPASFSGIGVFGIVEGPLPGQYLRIQATTPFTPGSCSVVLADLMDNFFGFDDISIADATAGISEYRATIIRNESSGIVGSFQRWIGLLGTPRISNTGVLGGSGSGTLQTSGSLADWPDQGWARIETSGGTLREVVYYNSKSSTALTVPASGRGLLGTSATAGALTDRINPVPGVALGTDPTGVVGFGSSIQTIASAIVPPIGVTWDLGITQATGLAIGNIPVGQQVGIWMWRQSPAGAKATPLALTSLSSAFSAF